MEELAGFAAAHPEFCDPKAVRVPGHGTMPSLEGGRPFELTADALSAYRAEVPKDPATLPAMLKLGPEAVAFYASFRLAPDRWGIYVREAALRALKEEYHRIIWRDLGKYADRNVDDVAEKVETTLVLDYLLAHNRIHFLVDKAAAESELAAGAAHEPRGHREYRGGARQPRGLPAIHQSDVRGRRVAARRGTARRAERERVEGVLHRRAVRGRDGERPLEAAARMEGLREVPEPQDVRRRDELRADPVLVQPGDARARPEGIEPPHRGQRGRWDELLQGTRSRVPSRVPDVNDRRWMGARFYRSPS